MANLSIRKLDEQTYKQLQLRAAKHGISMEEEARRILYQAVSESEDLGAIFQKYFGAKRGVTLELHRKKPHEPLDFSE